MSEVTITEEHLERVRKIASDDAQRDFYAKHDPREEEVIADAEDLIFNVTGHKLHVFEDNDQESEIVSLVETYDEAYIDAYVQEEADFEPAEGVG